MIYVATAGKLYCLQAASDGPPAQRWVYSVGGHVPGPPVIGADGYVRVHAGDGSLHCVDPSGQQVWPAAVVGDPLGWASPIVDDEGSTWISSYNGGLLKVDSHGRTSGRAYFRSRQKLDSTGLIHRRVYYAGAEDGFVYAIDLDGRRGVNRWNHIAGQGKTTWFINSALAMAPDGTLVVASRDNSIYGFNAEGFVAWGVPMPGQMLGSPVVDSAGNIYVGVSPAARGGHSRGLLACVGGNSHRIQWQYEATAAIESTPVIGDDGLVYFGDNAGVVHAVDAEGKAQWTDEVGSPVRSAGNLVAPGQLTFGLDNDLLVVLKCSSQAVAEGGWPRLLGHASGTAAS